MSNSQKKNLAYTAALVTARRNLLITLEGVRINSKTTVKDAIVEESIIEEELDGFIKGSQVINGPIFEEDGTVKVTVAVKIWGKKDSLAGIVVPVINEQLQVVPSATPSVVPSAIPSVIASPVAEEKKDTYTSLIIDCSGLEIRPAMSPALYSESGKQIYTAGIPVSPSVVIEKGISRYYDTLPAAEKGENAGNKPLVVKAKKISGNFASDPIISDEDAKKIMEANESGRFLEKLNVLIVI